MFGKLLSYSLKGNTIDLNYEHQEAKIEFFNNSIFRIYACLEHEKKSFSIENIKKEVISIDCSKQKDYLIIKSPLLDLKIYDEFKIDIYYQNKLICEDYKGTRNPFERHAISLTESEEEKRTAKSTGEGEGHTINTHYQSHKIEILKSILPNSYYYGLGEKTGFLNKKDYEYEMWNTDDPSAHLEYFKSLYKSIPFFITKYNDISYGIFYDNTYRTFFDMGKENSDYIYFGSDLGNIDYYFILGPSIKQVVQNYGFLTGTTPLPKKKMLGIHQSRWSYGTKERVDQVINGYLDNDIPLDIIHLDIDYMDNYKVFTYDKKRFDLENNIKEWNKLGIEIVTIIDPGVKAEDSYDIYEEGKNNHLFCTQNGELYHNRVWPGKSAYPDFSSEETRCWWANNQKKMVDLGVSGIWNDMNEPASFDGPLPDDIEFKNDGRPTNHLEMHNVYGHLMAKATYDGLKKYTSERPFVITRAAYAGSQKYTTFWTGDNQSLWIHLQMAIPMLCNMSLSGLSFIGTDIGGFGGDVTKELLIRWASVGAFFPLCRNHASILTRDQEPNSFDKETLDCYRIAMKLRSSLIPYYYDLFYHGEKNYLPVLRPLILNYDQDIETYNLNDEFMIGDYLLVSPVLEQGKTKKLTYLPSGKWYNYHTNQAYTGNNYYIIDAPLDTCPLFVKEGSIIPTFENKQIIFNIYPGQGSYLHLLDDGKSFNYQKGVCTTYQVNNIEDEISIKVINNYKLYDNIIIRYYNSNINEILVDEISTYFETFNNYIEFVITGLSHNIKIK